MPASDRTASERPVRVAAIIVPVVVTVIVVAVVGVLIAPTRFDLSAVVALNAHRTGALGALTTAVYKVVSPAPAILITAIVAVVIVVVTRRIRPALVLIVTVAVTWLPSAIVKIAVHRARPTASALAHPFSPQPTDASYPSGHEVFVVAIIVALVLLCREGTQRVVVGIVGAVVVLGVAFSLVTDGVHYPSDVAASIVWALVIAPCVRAAWLRWADPRLAPVDRILSKGRRVAE